MAYQFTGVSFDVISKKEQIRRYLQSNVIVLSQEYLFVEMDRESALGKSTYRHRKFISILLCFVSFALGAARSLRLLV